MKQSMGERIAMLRKQRGMSQENLAEKLGVSSQAVSKWENDQTCPDILLLPKLAAQLGVTVDALLTGAEETARVMPEKQRKPFEELVMRIYILSADGDKVKVNLPMPLVKVCLEMGVDIAPHYAQGVDALKNLDLGKIMILAEQGLIGKLVEIESADGDRVEVVVE